MGTMFDWISYNRPDVTYIKGPDSQGNYSWDAALPNQQEIIDLVASYDPEFNVPKVPMFVTPRQIRLALIQNGILLSTIEAGIAALPEPNKSEASIAWEYSTEFHRDNPLLVALAPSLGFTEQSLDALFIYAETL